MFMYNAYSETEEKLGKIYTMCGNKPMEVSEMFAGDIGAIAKLFRIQRPEIHFLPKATQVSLWQDRLLQTLYIYEVCM